MRQRRQSDWREDHLKKKKATNITTRACVVRGCRESGGEESREWLGGAELTPSPRGKRGNMLKQGKTSQLAGLFKLVGVLGARRRREMPTDRGTPVIPSVAPYQKKQQLYPYIRKGGKGDQRAAKKCATTHRLLAANANKQSLGFPRTTGSRKSDGSATHEQAYRIKPRVRDRVLPLGPKGERVSDQPVVLPDREPLVSSDPACGKTHRCLYIHTYIHTHGGG